MNFKPIRINFIKENHYEIIWKEFIIEITDDILGIENSEIGSLEELIGMILHNIQQGVSSKLLIHDYEVSAILMDQTGGKVIMDDIFKVDHHLFKYQRLRNIINKRFEP